MIKNQKMFLSSLLLVFIGVFGGIVLDAKGEFSNTTFSILSIPVASNEVYFLQGMILLGVTCVGLFILPFSLKERRVVTTFACMLAVIVMPHVM